MANRPVYVSIPRPPFYQRVDVEFTFNPGFSTTQKRKNIEAIHQAFLRKYPDKAPLEISSKSMNPLGVNLSAFNLKKRIPSLKIEIPVENVYQGGKKFVCGGPYTDLYYISPKDAKRDERLKLSGPMRAFTFEGVDYPLEPKNGFYDWLYIQAIHERKDIGEEIQNYNAFTDVEFNPEKSINCQARAAAMFVGIAKAGLLDMTRDFYEFCKLTTGKANITTHTQVAQETKLAAEPSQQNVEFSEGQVIRHYIFGEGKIIKINGDHLKILFPCGEKTLASKWVSEKCTY